MTHLRSRKCDTSRVFSEIVNECFSDPERQAEESRPFGPNGRYTW